MSCNYETIGKFEAEIAEFFGASFAVATDCCTHALELCLRHLDVLSISVPKRTYPSVPMLAKKLNIKQYWRDEDWVDYYEIYPDIYDAAVLWKPKSYIPNTFMCLSFQYQKHLSLGRGGMILCDDEFDAIELKKMSYDGRLPHIPWREQNISSIGYHYYMTPETAHLGLTKLPMAKINKPKSWTINDWPDISKMDVFNE